MLFQTQTICVCLCALVSVTLPATKAALLCADAYGSQPCFTTFSEHILSLPALTVVLWTQGTKDCACGAPSMSMVCGTSHGGMKRWQTHMWEVVDNLMTHSAQNTFKRVCCLAAN